MVDVNLQHNQRCHNYPRALAQYRHRRVHQCGDMNDGQLADLGCLLVPYTLNAVNELHSCKGTGYAYRAHQP